MSLILEALKKSEARRQLGEAPGIGTPFTVVKRRRSPLPLLLVLVAAFAAFGWYFLRTRHAATPATSVAGSATATRSATRARSGPADRISQMTTARQRRMEMARRAASKEAAPGLLAAASPPNAPQAAPAAAAAPPQPGVAETPAERMAARVVRTAPAVGRTSSAPGQPAAAAPAMPPAPQAGTRKPEPDRAAPAAAAKPEPAARATKPPAPAPGVGTSISPDLPLYYELPYNVRKDLPALTISVHVYSATPAQRFVIIDGERKVEGDTVHDGLTLREIRPNGIVLEFHGQRFFYPRQGR